MPWHVPASATSRSFRSSPPETHADAALQLPAKLNEPDPPNDGIGGIAGLMVMAPLKRVCPAWGVSAAAGPAPNAHAAQITDTATAINLVFIRASSRAGTSDPASSS